MSKLGRPLSAEEERLWRRVASTVATKRPLDPAPVIDDVAPAPIAKRATAAPLTKPKPTPLILNPAPIPANRGGEKRVRRGRVDLAAALDLHGYTAPHARRVVERFLLAQFESGARAALIVTGKGRRSQDGEIEAGVLKRSLPEWLGAPALREIVSGYSPAHAKHGGGGAFYVFLRRGGG